jgi:hypothetical protein
MLTTFGVYEKYQIIVFILLNANLIFFSTINEHLIDYFSWESLCNIILYPDFVVVLMSLIIVKRA